MLGKETKPASSLKITAAYRSGSAFGKRRTIAFFAAIFFPLSARHVVTTTCSPSGMAEATMVRAMAILN